jgi:hypothetical protein
MKVQWLNCELTFQPETPAEEEALMAVWVALGSQIDERPGFDDYELESGKFVDPSAVHGLHTVRDQ